MGFKIEKSALLKYTEENGVTDVVVPDGVIYISESAFENCSGLISIILPDSVTYIGDNAFYNCKNLESINIHNNITYIGSDAFCNCESLKSITIPDSITSINEETFDNCKSLTSIIIPDSVTSIRVRAFCQCSNLISITIPDNVTFIDYNAFSSCSNLTSITIPDSVIYIGSRVFMDCPKLTIKIKSKNSDSEISVKNIKKPEFDIEKIIDFIKTETPTENTIIDDLENFPYKVDVALYMMKKYESEYASGFLKNKIRQAVSYVIDSNDAENLTYILSLGYVTEQNIDSMIKYAIETKKPEMQVILSNYKNDNFGFDDNFDKFML